MLYLPYDETMSRFARVADKRIPNMRSWAAISAKRFSAVSRLRRDACALLFALCAVLLLPREPSAESPAVAHVASVHEDEEGGKLSFPFVVYSERAMNELYVIDSRTRVIIYTADFFPLFTLDRTYGIEAPLSLAVDAEGNLYVAQAPSKSNPRSRISVLNASLAWERDIYLTDAAGAGIPAPTRIAVDAKGRIYAAVSDGSGVVVLSREGRLIEMLTQEEDGKNVRVSNVTVDAAGRIYLVSEEMSRVYVYDETGKFLFKFGEKGAITGKLSRPQAVGVDADRGRMYVLDYMRHTVSTYDQKGVFLSEFGGMGWSPGWLQFPRDMVVDREGRVLVADTFNHRVEVFRP